MNIYKSLLFLHGYLLDPTLAHDDFGPTYGNRVASEKALRERWQLQRDHVEIGPVAIHAEPCGVGCGSNPRGEGRGVPTFVVGCRIPAP